MITMKIEGLEALEKAIDKMEKRFERAMVLATREGAKIVTKAAKENCRVETGNLKRSIKYKIAKRKTPGEVVAVIGPTVGKRARYDGWYGRLVENGTSKAPPHPFLRPALDNNQQVVQERIAQVYRDAVDGKALDIAIDAIEEVLFDV